MCFVSLPVLIINYRPEQTTAHSAPVTQALIGLFRMGKKKSFPPGSTRHPHNSYSRGNPRRISKVVHLSGRERAGADVASPVPHAQRLSHNQLFSLIPFPDAMARDRFCTCVEGFRVPKDNSFPRQNPLGCSVRKPDGEIKVSNTPLWLLRAGIEAVGTGGDVCIVPTMELSHASNHVYLIEGRVNRHRRSPPRDKIDGTILALHPFVESVTIVPGSDGDEVPYWTVAAYLPSCGIMLTIFAPSPTRNQSRFSAYPCFPLSSSFLRIRTSDGGLAKGGFFEAGSIRLVCRIRFGSDNCRYLRVHHLPDSRIQLVPDHENRTGAVTPAWKRMFAQQFVCNWNSLSIPQRRLLWYLGLIDGSTFGPIKRRYVPRLLYKNIDSSAIKRPYIIDVAKLPVSRPIVLQVVGNRHCMTQVSEVSTVRLIRLDLSKEYRRFEQLAYKVQAAIRKRGKKHAVRTSDGSLGSMFAVGSHLQGHSHVLYAGTNDINSEQALSQLMMEFRRILHRFCPLEAFTLSAFAASHGLEPPEQMGGSRGPSLSMNISRNLGNAPHFDTGDIGPGVSIWTEDQPGTARNWSFVMPNLIFPSGHPMRSRFGGFVVNLCHGALIQWDGVAIRHCTSVTDVGDKNSVYGFHVTSNWKSLKGNVSG